MKYKYLLILSLFILVVIIAGCIDKSSEKVPSDKTETEVAEKEVAEIIGPAGCKSASECSTYCAKNSFDCTAWCSLSKDTCDKLGIQANILSGIPGSPCTSDSECKTRLCLDYKCDIPSPDNLAKKSDFKMPGGCKTIADCAQYCAKPGKAEECQSFCEKFPSFCGDISSGAVRAMGAPPECQDDVKCESKDCISDAIYNCYAYMPVKAPDLDLLKKGIIFERKYQTPIKAVWEPGPAYNRIGMQYFVNDYKDLGVNTYSVTPKYNHKDGKLTHSVDHATGEKADNEKIATIIRAKKAGLQVVLVAHDLYDMFPDVSGKDPNLNPADYYDDIEETALKWAKVAEDYKVEYFTPVNEFEYVMYENGYTAEEACSATNNLYKKIIPKVREIYKGKIYCRSGGMDAKFDCMDYSQCDIFGFTYGFSGGSPKTNFDKGFAKAEEVSARDKKPYIMAEAFAFNTGGIPACADLHKAGIQSYKENAKSGIGYTFMGLIQRDPINKNDCTINEAGVVQDYKDFFKWLK